MREGCSTNPLHQFDDLVMISNKKVGVEIPAGMIYAVD